MGLKIAVFIAQNTLPQAQAALLDQIQQQNAVTRMLHSKLNHLAQTQRHELLRQMMLTVGIPLCQQLLIGVNRDVLRYRTAQEEKDSYRMDPKMEEVIRYISAHLEENLSVDALAKQFYLSRYYLMHRFKDVTGYTPHQYISQKRLLLAGELIRQGVPVMKAAEQAGYTEYSTFLRAFQSTFHMSPREFR